MNVGAIAKVLNPRFRFPSNDGRGRHRMDVIDEEGNLFGRLNVIDAVVVLVVLGVVLSGVAVLVPSEESPDRDTTGYATIELDQQPASVAEQVSAGDEMARGGQTLRITDVYVGPGDGGAVSITVRAMVVGTAGSDDRIRFGGDAVRPGRALQISTAEYDVGGTVTSVSKDGSRLAVENTTVRLRRTVASEVAYRIDQGDTYELAGRQVATITRVDVFPAANQSQRRVSLLAEVRTLRDGGVLRFGRGPVKVGSSLELETVEYDLDGTVVERGVNSVNSTSREITATVEIPNTSSAVADALEVGDEERFRDNTYARVTDVRVEPAVVIVTDEEGQIHERDHPRNKDVTLTLTVTVRDTNGGLLFHGERLQRGTDVVLDFDTVTVRGTVVALEAGV